MYKQMKYTIKIVMYTVLRTYIHNSNMKCEIS